MIQNFKLGELFEIQIGKTPARGDKKMWDLNKKSNNIWLSIKDLKQVDANGYISDSAEYISDDGAKFVRLVPKNTLLLSFKLTLGRTAITKIPLRTNEAIAALLPKTDKSDLRYLKYYLEYFDFVKFAKNDFKVKGLTLNKKKLAEIPIPLPSLQEQKKIVEKLDNFEQIISKLNMNRINKINEYKKFIKSLSLLLPDKDTKVFQIDDITVEYGRGKSKHRPRNFKGLYDGKYPFIQTGDIRNSNIYIKKYKKTYNESGLKQSKLWPAGTICLNIAANVGDVAILTFDACFPDSVLGIKANTEIVDDKYLYYLLFKKFDEINKMSENSAAQKNFNLQKLRALRFNVPSLEVQKDIISKLDSAFKNIKILTNTLDIQDSKINLLSKSVLNKEFSYE